jgi:hypothetical protein
MMKNLIFFMLFMSQSLNAQELTGFAGCGEYLLKGVLVKNKKNVKMRGPLIYKTNVQTKSEMQFIIKESDDLALLVPYVNIPTEIRANVSKMMDGTKGEIHRISKISLRKNNPLVVVKNSGMLLIHSQDCQ